MNYNFTDFLTNVYVDFHMVVIFAGIALFALIGVVFMLLAIHHQLRRIANEISAPAYGDITATSK